MMNAPSPVAPTYRALSGSELKELILRRIAAELDKTGKFLPHVTFPCVQFYMNLQVQIPLMRDRDFSIAKSVEEAVTSLIVEDGKIVDAETIALNPEHDGYLYNGEATEVVSVETSIVETPEKPADAIREEAGLPVIVQEISKGHGGFMKISDREIVREPKGASKKGSKR